jgi:hypothetical protein
MQDGMVTQRQTVSVERFSGGVFGALIILLPSALKPHGSSSSTSLRFAPTAGEYPPLRD